MSGRALSERALLVLLAAVTATGPVALNIYLPVLPLAQAGLGASVEAASATVTAPLVAFAVGLFVYGPLSDRYGRRRVILAGLAVFLAGTALALAARSVGLLTLARVVVALGSSAGATVARAAIGDRYVRDRMAHKLATLTMVMSVANSTAPALGGALGEAFGWRAVFWALLAAGAPLTLMVWRFLPETRDGGAGRSAREVGAATAALIRTPAFRRLALQSAVIYAVFFVFVAMMPYVFQSLGRRPSEYGLWYLTLSGGYFAGNWVVSRYTLRLGMRRLMGAGIALQAVAGSLGLGLALAGLWHPFWLFAPWIAIGFAQGLALPNLTASAVALAPRYAGAAAGLLGFSQQALGALAVQGMSAASTATPVPVTAFVAATTVAAYAAHRLAPAETTHPATG
ncbi:MAG: multidrug effflux MFS transporter [Proteobacteria bacterium]|nr:multidrug effflux MFS transporter [Pseudomonadota bacterium]